MHFIDPPSPFAQLQEWKDHLADLRAIKEPDEQVKEHIETAEKYIKAHESGGLQEALKLDR